MSRKDQVITFAVSAALTYLLEPILTSKSIPSHSFRWWIFLAFFLLFTNYVISNIYKYLLIPPTPNPIVPKIVSAFDNAIREAGYNFSAVSSKEIALWRSPTFIYYLTLNDIKNIIEYSLKNRNIMFSNDSIKKEDFFSEGFEIVNKMATGQVHTDFFGMRLLIYPEKIYNKFENEIRCLIQMHSIARVHCIPVVREKLIQKFNNNEKAIIGELVRLFKQNVKEEYTNVSGWDKLILKLTKNYDSNPYKISIPDFLIINYNPDVREKEQVWWYKKDEPLNQDSSPVPVLPTAGECYKLLCSKISQDITWSKYTPDIFSMVPVGTLHDEPIDFFSQDYFEMWLNEIIPKDPRYSILFDWIKKEEEVIRTVLRANRDISEVLDIGCGWGRHSEIILEQGVEKVAAIDNNALMIQKMSSRLYPKYDDRLVIRLEEAQKLSFQSNKFDLVICMTNTFGNLGPEAVKVNALEEMVRVLKPGGKIILSVYRNSKKALELRMQSYLKVGLHPYILKNDRTIKTKEGLVSEQFDIEYVKKLLKKCDLSNLTVEEINESALILIAEKVKSLSVAGNKTAIRVS